MTSQIDESALASLLQSLSFILKKPSLDEQLNEFFDQLRASLIEQPPSVPDETLRTVLVPQYDRMEKFFEQLPSALASEVNTGHFSNVWQIASLKRDEVRNSAVLGWWIDPKAGHGLGDALLQRLLRQLTTHADNDFPRSASRYCAVRVEHNPDGEQSSRVDIEIDDLNFFLVIEVKIDAPEGAGQLDRYCNIARRKAGSRPWRVIFLTPQARRPLSPVQYPEHLVCMSWRQVGRQLNSLAYAQTKQMAKKGILAPDQYLMALVARQFASHIFQL